MTLWAAIPVKPLAEGKSRLAAALSPQARERLNSLLFRQTLDAVGAVIRPENVIVVSRDASLRDAAAARGMRVIAERGNTLNEALGEALEVAQGGALLAISTDLPEITSDDVRAMLIPADGPGVSIAPDRAGRGTNALFTVPAGCVPFCFGDDSFAAHLAAARRRGIGPKIVSRPGLAFDLDLPDDMRFCPTGWFF
jgi:2-phospho-L-lactate guanylyltransferase